MSRVLARWWPSCAGVLGAAAVVVASRGAVGVASVVLALVLLGYAWLVSPAFFPRSADLRDAVERAAAGGAPVVFWKPGCLYCIKLRVVLGSAGRRVSWVDSSIDEQAEVVVRAANDGNHTTPTVMSRDETRTNPDADWVRSLVSDQR